MDILLTESQYIKLILEKKNDEVESSFSNSKSLVQDIIKDVKSKHGIDFTFAGTWGAVLGGFMGPINDYLHGTYSDLSKSDISLISFGILLTFFSSNEEKLNKVLKIIKKEKLITFFDRGMMKAYDLKDAFFSLSLSAIQESIFSPVNFVCASINATSLFVCKSPVAPTM
jgi:hypothetical protein